MADRNTISSGDRICWSLLLALATLAPGCGGKELAEVSGRVTFRGEPVTGGPLIVFSNFKRGIFITSELDGEGRYRVQMAEGYGLPPGEYQVSVIPPPMSVSAEFIEKHRDKPPELAAWPNIPLKYRDAKTSGVLLDLPPDGAVFDLDMKP